MVPSSAGPALSRISGECTRPSVPMIKLTLTLVSESMMLISGFGVASSSGGSEASQVIPALACSMAAKLESRSVEPHISPSRAPSDDAGSRNCAPGAVARQLTEVRIPRSNQQNPRTVMSDPQHGGIRKHQLRLLHGNLD